ncbi:thiamine diphosphokinase [Clostridium sp. 19966]|uniref:thiamine diphosphokinase n=1 Tax=Clostridium sp. 19966 TaxID=2768166 RepID=UPI0028DD6B13|nr:thiamine diphosphokinase [Clostridium sp. 19966]MDT8716469.1 thiamine diphosphokinase [Clostridium sp. 19966]
MKVLIVSAGNRPCKKLIEEEAMDSDYIIGVDKGNEYLYESNMIPNLMLGDFDSIDEEKLNNYIKNNNVYIRYPAEKDYTDTELAVIKSIELGAKAVTILGCIGTRMDHTLGNIGLLYRYLEKNIEACIIDENNKIFMINKGITLKPSNFKYFSLVAFGGMVKGLSIKNAKYDLNNHDLFPYSTITISNEFKDKDVRIDFETGTIIVAFTKD